MMSEMEAIAEKKIVVVYQNELYHFQGREVRPVVMCRVLKEERRTQKGAA